MRLIVLRAAPSVCPSAAACRTIPVKFDSMPEHLEVCVTFGDCQPVQRLVRQIFDPPTSQTNEMVMEREIAVEPRSITPIVHLVR